MDESQIVSNEIDIEETNGIFHFMLLVGDDNVYTFNPVRNTPIKPLIKGGISSPTFAVVDGVRKFLFVS